MGAADDVASMARLLHGLDLGASSFAEDWFVVAPMSARGAIVAALLGQAVDALEVAAQQGRDRMQHAVERHWT